MKSLQFSLLLKQFPAPNGTIDKKKAKNVYHGEKNVSSSQIKKENIEKKAKLLKNGVDIINKPDRYP